VIKVQAKAKVLAQRKSRQVHQANVQEQRRKGLDAKTKQPVQMVAVTYTRLHKTL